MNFQGVLNMVLMPLMASLLGGLTAAVKKLWNKQKEQAKAQEKRQETVEKGVMALLHDGLFRACSTALEKGKINVDEMDNINYLYKPYATLGGNGTGKQLFERVNQLPIESADK